MRQNQASLPAFGSIPCVLSILNGQRLSLNRIIAHSVVIIATGSSLIAKGSKDRFMELLALNLAMFSLMNNLQSVLQLRQKSTVLQITHMNLLLLMQSLKKSMCLLKPIKAK